MQNSRGSAIVKLLALLCSACELEWRRVVQMMEVADDVERGRESTVVDRGLLHR